MCWSATADLVAGAGIVTIGVTTVALSRRVRDLPLAALPLLLGAHQIVESEVWRSGGGAGAATVVWAVVALPLLALWVPAGVLCAAPAGARARLAVPLTAGVLTAALLSYSLATRPVTAEVRGHTLGYALDLPHSTLLLTGYLLATVGSLLLSADRWLQVLGLLVAVGAAVCAALWRLEFISTWCAFAAVCSVVLLGWSRRGPPETSAPAGSAPAG
ncbi:hypothetical protein F0344_33150 [Streptomyces finlayi]|uniref:DUF998 domain-containing protein n=1 Tax=Streptomyces finlayi TaxID=67296 RepID=A0A7G7BW30_9ACTN|nr:DUF6629 family protein [Streptomyces finlayi]QNE79545.1 hypothetical protein F0344_33150 [Streptomyces finlayi]